MSPTSNLCVIEEENMGALTPKSRGMYFEEFEVGQKIVSSGITVTESHVVSFAGLTGDYTQLHIDAEYSKNTIFEQRIAHGLLILSIASGLASQIGFIEGTVIAFREINQWKFIKPVFFGDTIHVEIEVVGTKLIRRLNAGSVELDLRVKNQANDTTMKGRWTVLIAKKPD
jgi:acyl dehydratase